MPQADTPTSVASVRVDTSARPGIEWHSVRSRCPRVKPRTGTRVAAGDALRVERRRGRVPCGTE